MKSSRSRWLSTKNRNAARSRGELWLLERGWREAEEIAAIADRLLLPDGVREAVGRTGESLPAKSHEVTE